MSDTDFYDVDELEKIAVNLFHGWGYNFYRLENQLRADDLTVRAKVSWLLGLRRRASVETAESAYRRERLAAPTREKPLPDPDAIAGAQMLERLSQEIGALEGRIRAQPVPENDGIDPALPARGGDAPASPQLRHGRGGPCGDAAGHARPEGRRLDDREVVGDSGRPQEHRGGVAGSPDGAGRLSVGRTRRSGVVSSLSTG